jgi:hypothetical protein
MSIEKTAEPHSEQIQETRRDKNTQEVDWTGLTPATNAGKPEAPRPAARDMGEDVIEEPGYPGIGQNTNNATPMPEEAHTVFPGKPERGSTIDRSPEPDARDDEKVERLAAPDWRSEQPLPSAKNAVDPRGENTPSEMFDEDETQGKHK